MNQVNKAGAPKGNDNAAKDPEERKESFLHIDATHRDKHTWYFVARMLGVKLTKWVTGALNDAAEREIIAQGWRERCEKEYEFKKQRKEKEKNK